MFGLRRLVRLGLGSVGAGLGGAVGVRAAPAPAEAAPVSIDLSRVFGTRSAWRFTASEAAPIDDPFGSGGDKVPGLVTLCLRRDASGPCDFRLRDKLDVAVSSDLFSEPHSLEEARIVHPRRTSGRPLLLVRTAGLRSGDGDQLVLTQVLAYARDADRFVRIYLHSTGTNNNQEVRYVDAGPLEGDIISVEPTEDAPFGFWVAVSVPASGSTYKAALRYRSATRYGDGNALPVIDSEMPNIQQRLGVWRPGLPLPLPAGPCARPRLVRTELWCG